MTKYFQSVLNFLSLIFFSTLILREQCKQKAMLQHRFYSGYNALIPSKLNLFNFWWKFSKSRKKRVTYSSFVVLFRSRNKIGELMKTCLHHSHKKRRDNLEIQVGVLFFMLEISGLAVQEINQNSKNSCFKWWFLLWRWLSCCFIHFSFLSLWCKFFLEDR